MQEECRLGFGPLGLPSLRMVEAMKPQALKLFNHIRVVPPTIPNIPTGIAVEVSDDDKPSVWPNELCVIGSHL